MDSGSNLVADDRLVFALDPQRTQSFVCFADLKE